VPNNQTANLDLTVLGPVGAKRDGRDLVLGGRRQRLVLAALLIAQGRVLPAARLQELVWSDAEHPASRNTLHGYVAGLRRVLEPGHPARAGQLLVREGPGYALRLPPEHVDADRFGAAVEQGAALIGQGRAALALPGLESALRLWRGPAYADVSDFSFVLPEAVRLDGLRAAAVELRLTALLELGHCGTVLGELEALTIEQPLRERGWELLALALYRAGRQGDALAVIRRARAGLATELGVDPGPALRRLEEGILTHRTELQPRPARPMPHNVLRRRWAMTARCGRAR
jgi:DNA-binding SARP family transcriptional activator